jgi:hypothetical protein
MSSAKRNTGVPSGLAYQVSTPEMFANGQWFDADPKGITFQYEGWISRIEKLAQWNQSSVKRVQEYASNLSSLADDLHFLHSLLDHTIDDPALRIYQSQREKDWILNQVARALESLTPVFRALHDSLSIPVRESVVASTAKTIRALLEITSEVPPECPYDERQGDRNAAEAALVQQDWPPLQEEAMAIRSHIAISGPSTDTADTDKNESRIIQWEEAKFEVDSENRVIKRHEHCDATFTVSRQNDGWQFATLILEAKGECVDFSSKFPMQKPDSLRKIKQKVRDQLIPLGVAIENCPGHTSTWKAVLETP